MSSKLYVGNLSFETTESAVNALFSQEGTVTSTAIITDKFTGKSRGFAFVEMASVEDANKAIASLHSKDLNGRTLTVSIARPKEDRSRGSSAGQRR